MDGILALCKLGDPKVCAVLIDAVVQHHVIFTVDTLNFILPCLFNFIRHGNEVVQTDALRAMGYVLFENGSKCVKHYQAIMDILNPFLVNGNEDSRSQALNCLGNITVKAGAKLSSYHVAIFSQILKNLQASLKGSQKVLAASLRAAQCVILEGKGLHVAHVSSLITILKQLIHTSSSEKVRAYALNVIGAMAKSDSKSMYVHWPALLPDTPKQSASLFAVLLGDASPKVRAAAAGALSAILETGKGYLSVADDKVHTPSSFTPLSATLANMVREMHVNLLNAVKSESHSATLLQVLKTVTLLVAVAPYARLSSGYLTKITSQVAPLLSHAEANVRTTALSVVAAVYGCKIPVDEVSGLLLSNPEVELAHLAIPTPLLEQVLKFIEEDTGFVRMEALQVLARIATSHCRVFGLLWKRFSNYLIFSLKDTDAGVRLQACKCLEAYTKALSTGGFDEDEEPITEEHAETASYLHDRGPHGDSEGLKTLWEELLTIHIPVVVSDDSPLVRASACTVYSHINANIFERMSQERRIAAITIVFGMAVEEGSSVRAAGCRTLGVFVLFPQLKKDSIFMTDAAQTLCDAMADNSMSVRVRACWSIANLCDAFCSVPQVVRELDPMLINTIADKLLIAVKDNDKLRANVVRALGHLLRFTPVEWIQRNAQLSQTLVSTLIDCVTSGPMKVRWNACYAVGAAMENPYVHIPSSGFAALITIIKSSPNYKTRINAAIALKSARREQFGDSLGDVWRGLVSAFEHIEETEDFAAYQYKQTLLAQLLRTFAYVVSVTNGSPEDLNLIANVLPAAADVVADTLIHKGIDRTTCRLLLGLCRSGPHPLATEDATSKLEAFIASVDPE